MDKIKLNWQQKIKFWLLFLKKFRMPLVSMWIVILGGGYLIQLGYENVRFTDAMLEAFAAAFFEIIPEPPYRWYVQIFLYLAPFAGIFFIADSISILAHMLLGKRRQLQEWWIMTAATYENHLVVCGVGKVGYRIINELIKMGEPVVAIEMEENSLFVQELREKNVPIIIGNVRIKSVLEKANVHCARAVMCVTEDDLTNLDCAFTIHEINPHIRVVLRMFDDTIANKISYQFNLPAISTSRACAPAFISKALALEIPQMDFDIYGHNARISSLRVSNELDGKTVGELESNLKIKVLGYKNPNGDDIFPAHHHNVKKGDQLLVAGLSRQEE